MLPLLFAVFPAAYTWNRAGFGAGLLVAVIAFGAFLVWAAVQARKVEEIDFTFDVFYRDLRRKRLLGQILVPSVTGWPLAWLMTSA